MSLFDLFSKDVQCPSCGDPAARQAIWGTVRCPNPNCERFSEGLVEQRAAAQRTAEMKRAVAAGEARVYRNPRTGDKVYKLTTAGSAAGFDPAAHRIDVNYTNAMGEDKTFTGDWRTLRRRGRHFSLRVLPTGIRIALAIDKIGNLQDVEQAIEKCPSPYEARVLKYHARRGTSSARFEELRRKYPEWSVPS